MPPAAGQPVVQAAIKFGEERDDRHREEGDDARPDERDIVIIVRFSGDDGDDFAARRRLGRGDRRGDDIMVGFADMADFHGPAPLPAARGAAAPERAAAARETADAAAPEADAAP